MIVYDSVNAAAIPELGPGEYAAGYVDGRWPSYFALVDRFGAERVVGITITPRAGIRVADCEAGDFTPAEVAVWAREEIGARRRPTIYTTPSNWMDSVQPALAAVGVPFVEVDWWCANWNFKAELYPGSVATQYSGGQGFSFDTSITAADWPFATPLPLPVNPPAPQPPTTILYAIQGEPMVNHFVEMSLDGDGCGAVLLDAGKVPLEGIESMGPAIPWTTCTGWGAQGSCPTRDKGYWKHTAHCQNYGGYVLLTITGGVPFGRAGACVFASD